MKPEGNVPMLLRDTHVSRNVTFPTRSPLYLPLSGSYTFLNPQGSVSAVDSLERVRERGQERELLLYQLSVPRIDRRNI